VTELEQINALGTVPTLVMDDGKTLTQNTAVLEYLAEVAAQDSSFLPRVGTYERLNVIRWLAFVAADFHKAFTISFRAEDLATAKEAQGQIE
jgi:glutathione S-transferase